MLRVTSTTAAAAAAALAMVASSSFTSKPSRSSANQSPRAFASCEPIDDRPRGSRSFDVYLERESVGTKELRMLVRQWEAGKDVWPWIWLWRNPNGPHHVFVGLAPHAIASIERLAVESENNNMTIIIPAEEWPRHQSTATPAFLERNRCGLICGDVRLMDVR